MDHTRRRQLASDLRRAVLIVCRSIPVGAEGFEDALEIAISDVVRRYFPDTPIPAASDDKGGREGRRG